MSFNNDGAHPRCSGTGLVREVDVSKLVPDWEKTLDEGVVESWKMFGTSWIYRVVKSLGVGADTPFRYFIDEERDIAYNSPKVTKLVAIESATGKVFDLNRTYRNTRKEVEKALNNASTEKGSRGCRGT